MMLPVDFIDEMRQELGAEAEELFLALDTPPVTSIRLNDKRDELSFPCDIDEVPWHVDGYYLSERPQFTLDPLMHAGCYYVQEASSMFLQQALDQYVPADSIVLDLCAAPGGKSTLISQHLGQEGLLVSNEVNRQRLFILSENLQKWGNGNAVVTHNQPADFGTKCVNLFDCMLVDAPCSGEGMMRKDEEARAQWSLKNVQMCAERQRSILMDAWDCLKPGGVLIYSTCTFNQEENENNVQWMMECLGATVLPLDVDESWDIVEGNPGYHFYPHRTKGEGFYICALRKNEEVFAPFKIKDAKSHSTANNQNYVQIATSWLANPEDWAIRQSDRFLTAYAMRHKQLIDILSERLTCITIGFGLGEERGKSIAPQHSLALSKALRRGAFPELELSLEQALAYLRTETVFLTERLPLGQHLLTYQGVPLGFAKNVGNRLNNHYPNEWRIRNL
ncbi:MAG: rRNA cytosine-C5-methyltransferase [Paludibacteraceae bacterium]|nr:rRNA cytosine-C5-methyltransferase [Paludibacteraceae bacterium]